MTNQLNATLDFKAVGASLSNWGRWGEDDERGTLNLITPEVVLRAAASIRTGRSFHLSIDLNSRGPQKGTDLGIGRVDPIHVMSVVPGDYDSEDRVVFADDYMIMPLQAATQWDGLGHCGYDGFLYNGVPVESVTALRGVERNAIDKVLPGVTGRGVLLDVARLRGVDWIAADAAAITAAELDETARSQGVDIRTGDIVLIRTGWIRKGLSDGFKDWMVLTPGVDPEVARWLHEKEAAAVASDNCAVEKFPAEGPTSSPFHCIVIRDMGMMLGEIFNLERLAADCAEDGQYDFFFTGVPLPVTGGAGSPVTPIAIK